MLVMEISNFTPGEERTSLNVSGGEVVDGDCVLAFAKDEEIVFTFQGEEVFYEDFGGVDLRLEPVEGVENSFKGEFQEDNLIYKFSIIDLTESNQIGVNLECEEL